MLLKSIFATILAIILVCWLGHVTCQAADDEIEIGEAGNEVPSKNEFPVWDDAQGEWPGVGDNVD
ncbi:uncharacterized protein Dana_GF13740 [Drosophila ananassae]|uniref:Secreted protein n=1 Tax=Drosophila ananassae TaxID=7217 RepID=B3MI00_DROAN|nr:uncharacterized protein LOC6496576 [Drosophila ananassae]EDV38010.1 uncharacterized protein Dana_GF13740 [Drosophila ananassae]